MKRIIFFIVIINICIIIGSIDVYAVSEPELNDIVAENSLESALPHEVCEKLYELGINDSELSSVNEIKFNDILRLLLNTLNGQGKETIPLIGAILAVLLLHSIFSTLYDSLSNRNLSDLLAVISALCVSCVLIMPVTELIDNTAECISISADMMIGFIPVMTALLVSSGQGVMGSGYSAMMLVAAEGVAQFFSKVMSPILSIFLSLGVTTSIVSDINLSSLLNFFSKTIKWLLSFVFTIFTSLLTVKSLYSSAVDNVSYRAVRYTVSSFVPVVGGALSEAYRTVHGSVGILKSGVGIYIIIAVCVSFVPLLTKLLIWIFSVNICKCFAEVISVSSSVKLFTSVSTVLSLLFSVILCIVSLFVISTALVITIGGAR